MTYREKIAMDHPIALDPDCAGGVAGCPKDYHLGPEKQSWAACPKDCDACWNRECTKEQTEGEKEMPTTKVTTKKTKAELLDEIKNLTKEVEKLERYKKYEDAASEIAAMRDAFINEGFTREEALQLVNNLVSTAASAAFNR